MAQPLQLIAALLILAGSIWAVARKVDVRLALLVGALALGCVATDPMAVVRAFLNGLVDFKFVLPITCAMGFGYVLTHTGCAEHLARLLLKPFSKAPFLLVPGAIFTGFVVNIPVVSQSSTLATIGAVLVPVLRAAGISPLTTGAALLIGSSVGGELLNPAGPEYATVIREASKLTPPQVLTGAECVSRALPIVLLNLVVATLVFSFFASRREKAYRAENEPERLETKINLFKAFVPVVPLVILFLTAKPFSVIPLPGEPGFLVGPKELEDVVKKQILSQSLQDTRLIAVAMLIGVIAASVACMATAEDRKCVGGVGKSFFEGAGFAYANVISLIAVAAGFAEGIKLVGIGTVIGQAATAVPALLLPMAGSATLLFAVLCGSGIAATTGLVGIFIPPGAAHGMNLAHLGAFSAAGSALGRTMSPVSAVAIMGAKVTGTEVVDLAKAVAIPLLAAFACSTVLAVILNR